MSAMRYLAAISILCFLMNCSSSIQETSNGVNRFVFQYEGQSYTIISYTYKDKVGYNLLVSDANGSFRLRARDLYQDGTIDTVITGSISLAGADRIYQDGLKKAQQEGNLTNREIKRKYQTEDSHYKYVLHTILPIIGDAYNTFAVTEKILFAESVVIKDVLADGSLDEILVGKGDLAVFQPLYERVLQKGIAEKQLEKKETSYYVCFK